MRDWIDQLFADARVVELRHDTGHGWHCGTFDDPGLLRAEVERRSGAGNFYTSVNAPAGIVATNAMHGQPLRDVDIGHHVRLLLDFDPVRPRDTASTDDELRAAVAARHRMVLALLALGWPMPATAVSGNGAHAVYRCKFPTSAESKEILAALYAGLAVDFGTDDVSFDTTVRNPARVWRLYGTVNRKGTASAERPHRKSAVSIPQRWRPVSLRDVELLANVYARRQQPTPSPADRGTAGLPHINGAGDYTTLDVAALFRAHGAYRRPLADGSKHSVRCPWEHEHSTTDGDGSTATVVWDAHGQCWPNFRCLHAHCAHRGIRDVLALWNDADCYCSRQYAKGVQ